MIRPTLHTHLPFANFRKSAQSLSNRTLARQLMDGQALLERDMIDGRGFRDEPAVIMWHGYEQALVFYMGAIVTEHEARGNSEPIMWKFIVAHYHPRERFVFPWWLGDPDIHYSHQSNLLASDYHHYHNEYPSAPTGLKYIWPEDVASDATGTESVSVIPPASGPIKIASADAPGPADALVQTFAAADAPAQAETVVPKIAVTPVSMTARLPSPP